ncbi:ABC transporter ATP-binding protein [Candidatus Methanoperedens nitratireducens]|uniref:ABC transporter domain-containing protein n=1 Tax=Candidatus Methanoperedens nitratireducens TaxID=1392998 RepID=A0A284VKF1_9EURY|nr:ABC transporter ATP-binding protein [Candidatus Methanoperedens nitroreducens]SNQ59689.1 conserved hypothetical protein [Candidatus Methanoperedens nitroreducens]
MRVLCRSVSKTFSSRNSPVEALRGISFELREKEFLCVLGPSGCGKTTLLKIVAGLLKPTSGKVVYSGEESAGPLNTIVFQEYGIFPWMNVIDNVAFGLEMHGFPKKERYEISMEFIKKVGLGNCIKKYPHELSVGMKQRVGIARAFANNPDVLLMDEPFCSLDAQTRLILQGELLRIWKEHRRSVIFVTHDIEEAIMLADRVIILTSAPGKIKEEMEINLSRPRDFEITNTREFARLRMKIWETIKEEVLRSMVLE